MDTGFVLEIQNNLSKNACDKIIQQFEDDPRKMDGVFGMGQVDKNVKTSVDLALNRVSHESQWKWVDELLSRKLSEGIRKYTNHVSKKYCYFSPNTCISFLNCMYDTGYQIQRTDPGGFYKWHTDFSMTNTNVRAVTFIWYLNTLEIEQEGATELIDGTKIRPEAGKLLLFPATWTGIHRGGVLKSGKKYIITGWLHMPKDMI